MNQIYIFDDVMPDPHAYRADALSRKYEDVEFSPTEIFRGISLTGNGALPSYITNKFPSLIPLHNFYRKSPAGQVEPNYIHSDAMMGDWTGILYLNEKPPVGDGTIFWRHHSGTNKATIEELPEYAGDFTFRVWDEWSRVDAKFNRLMMFPATYFHSRAMVNNYGEGDEARLIQVVFGTGAC